jgi:hypothetical protein
VPFRRFPPPLAAVCDRLHCSGRNRLRLIRVFFFGFCAYCSSVGKKSQCGGDSEIPTHRRAGAHGKTPSDGPSKQKMEQRARECPQAAWRRRPIGAVNEHGAVELHSVLGGLAKRRTTRTTASVPQWYVGDSRHLTPSRLCLPRGVVRCCDGGHRPAPKGQWGQQAVLKRESCENGQHSAMDETVGSALGKPGRWVARDWVTRR